MKDPEKNAPSSRPSPQAGMPTTCSGRAIPAGKNHPARSAPWVILLLALFFAPLTARAEAAGLPSRDARTVLPLLWHVSEHDSLRTIARILGQPDGRVTSGFYIYIYHLDDGTSVYVSTPDRHRIFGIARSAPGGIAGMVYEPLLRGQLKPYSSVGWFDRVPYEDYSR